MHTVIDDSYLKSSPLANGYLSDLNTLCVRDYKRQPFTTDIQCLDLDLYEDSLSGESDKTSDAAIGIADFNKNRVSNSRLLLVELRLDYKNVENQGVNNLSRKYNHSRDILIGTGATVDKHFLLVYDNATIAERNKHYLKRHRYSCPIVNTFESWYPEKIEAEIALQNNLYVYETDSTQLKQSLDTTDISVYFNRQEHWISEAEKYFNKYNLNETELIVNILMNSLAEKSLEGDNEVIKEILMETLTELQNRINNIKENL